MTTATAQPASVTERAGGVVLEASAAFLLWLTGWLAAWVLVPALLLGFAPIVVTSGSMGPVIATGDVVLLRDPPAGTDDALSPGTVITFRRQDQPGLVTHRIEALGEDGLYRTRGDANPTPDSTPVEPDDVVGVGVLLVPFVGLPRLWFDARSWLLAVWLATMLGAMLVVRAAPAGDPHLDVDGADDAAPRHAVPSPGPGSARFAVWLASTPDWAIPVVAGTVALLLVAAWSLA